MKLQLTKIHKSLFLFFNLHFHLTCRFAAGKKQTIGEKTQPLGVSIFNMAPNWCKK